MQDTTPAEYETYAMRSVMRNIRRRDMDICLLSLPPALLSALCFSKPSCVLQKAFVADEMHLFEALPMSRSHNKLIGRNRLCGTLKER